MTTNQQADRLAEEAKTWISQVCIAAHRRSPAQTKVAVEALEAFIEALATLARTPSVPDDVARDALADEAARDARQDALRIDHLQHRGATVEILPSGHGGWFFRIGGLHRAVHADIRQAIDAARASHEGEQP